VRLAGQAQQDGVLQRALDIGDPELALDAIDAIDRTVGTFRGSGNQTPLIEALVHGDARVRISAALALANGRPTQAFPGSELVVPILGQAVRVGSRPNALVVSAQSSDIVAALEQNGFQAAVGAGNLTDARSRGVDLVPSLDLLVYQGDAGGFPAFWGATSSDPFFRTLPVLVIAPEADVLAIRRQIGDNPRVHAASPSVAAQGHAADLAAASQAAIEAYRGGTISSRDAQSYATSALARLGALAAEPSIYSPTQVQGLLAAALSDARGPVAQGAGAVLARFPGAEAQRQLAAACFTTFGPTQVSLLESLAQSAMNHGNQLDAATLQKLVEFVGNARTGRTADAAAQALGALQPSPAAAAGLILN
jgi:hypothetical protein